jgi:hypothetical protein
MLAAMASQSHIMIYYARLLLPIATVGNLGAAMLGAGTAGIVITGIVTIVGWERGWGGFRGRRLGSWGFC